MLVVAIAGGYWKGWAWTGVTDRATGGKTLWDWMQLILVPAVLAFGAYLLNTSQAKRGRAIAADAQREQALQQYLDTMTEFMLDRQLRTSNIGDEVRTVARTQTLTVLRRLDGERKAVVLKFLRAADLIQRQDPILDLRDADLRDADLQDTNISRADLRDADLSDADLHVANLSRADLRDADLSDADLPESDLSRADLRDADLSDADLPDADLSGADLRDADLSGADLRDADLSGADLDGAIASPDTDWPTSGFDPTTEGIIIRP